MPACDLRHLAGQLLIAGFDGTTMTTALESFLGDMQPGGVILFARNLESAGQCHDLLAACRKRVEAPLFTCVDLEGGTVDRFRAILAPSPSQREVAAAHDPALATLAGKTLGTCVRALGFNTDFAPVSDIGFDASKSVLGSRAVSTDAAETAAYVRRFLVGLRSAGVLGCGKHFPGLGEGILDSHFSLPVIDKSWKRLWGEDLMPYRKSHRQMPFIMVAHAAYPSVTGDNTPASISRKWITDVLRKRIGYRGLIVSDDLEMGGVLAAGKVGEVTVECIRAGADMFLVCHEEDLVREAVEAVVRTAERDRHFARRVREAASQVLRYKARCSELQRRPSPRPTEATVGSLRRKIEALRERVQKAGGQ